MKASLSAASAAARMFSASMRASAGESWPFSLFHSMTTTGSSDLEDTMLKTLIIESMCVLCIFLPSISD